MSKEEKNPLWDAMVFCLPIAALPWWSFVFTIVCGWFVAPLGVPSIGMAHAFGLNLIVKAIVPNPLLKNKNDGWTDTERDAHSVAFALLGPLLLLGVAWVTHRLM